MASIRAASGQIAGNRPLLPTGQTRVITGNMVQRRSIAPVETALPAATRLQPTSVDIRSAPLQVRLAETTADIDAAQALRYRIFYERLGAQPLPETACLRREVDPFCSDFDQPPVFRH